MLRHIGYPRRFIKGYSDKYLVTKNEIDFRQLIQDLHNDFDKTIKSAEEEGVFKKDDEEHEEDFRRIYCCGNGGFHAFLHGVYHGRRNGG